MNSKITGGGSIRAGEKLNSFMLASEQTVQDICRFRGMRGVFNGWKIVMGTLRDVIVP
jgi:hypothetical protein